MGKTLSNGLPTLKEARKQEEKSEKDKRSRLRKIYAVSAAVVLALGAGVVATSNAVTAAEAAKTHISDFVPDTADTVVLAPSSKEWWDKVNKMTTLDLGVNDLDPYAAGLQIKTIGYSRTADTTARTLGMTGAIRSIYLESSTDDEASAVEKWFGETSGFASRSVVRKDNVVRITNSWVTDFAIPEKSVSSRSDYSMNKVDDKGLMWINFDNQINSLTNSKTENKPLVEDYFRKSFAVKQGTSWSGSSSDGATWYGKYTTGGIDMKQFDPESADKALQATKRELVAGSSSEVKVYDNGLYTLIMHSGFRNTEKSQNFGPVTVGDGAKVKNEKVAAVIEPSQWNTAAMGTGAGTEGISKITYSFSDSEMSVVLSYGSSATEPKLPDFKSLDSPGVTILPIPSK